MFTRDTVRLVVQFRDFKGNNIVPDEVKLTIFNTDKTVVEEVTEGIIDNTQGNFHFDYVAPEHDFIFEFSGIYDNRPVLARQTITTEFI